MTNLISQDRPHRQQAAAPATVRTWHEASGSCAKTIDRQTGLDIEHSSHEPTTLRKAVRQKCLQCSGGLQAKSATALCGITRCGRSRTATRGGRR